MSLDMLITFLKRLVDIIIASVFEGMTSEANMYPIFLA